MANYYVGNEARLSATFKDAEGTIGDPSTVVLMVKPPGGGVSTYTNGIVRDGLGVYHYDLLLNKAGAWVYKWKGTGGVNAASADSTLSVTASVFGNA